MDSAKERPGDLQKGAPRRFGPSEGLILLLLAVIAAMVWRLDARAAEIAQLESKLANEVRAHAVTRLSLNTAEFRAANRELDTTVKGDILDQRLVAQAARAEQLEKEAEALRQQLLRETNCVTPRSIRNAEGL
jgi:hypothetical protein